MTASSPTQKKLCRLHRAEGRAEECPETACAFWQPGGAVLDGRCAVEGVELAAHPELVACLLQIRTQLEAPIPAEEEEQARRLLYGLLNTGDADGG